MTAPFHGLLYALARVDEPTRASYRIGPSLGVGAIASVVEVTGPTGERHAAKILHASQQLDEAAVARFEQEAELLARLDHDNLVRSHGFVEIEGQRMLLMELVEGPTLAQLIARAAPLPEQQLLELGRGIAAGLAHAHAAGIIHRDLKPSNVLVASDDVHQVAKIADFGMARASSLAGVDRKAFMVIGTPDYMAPESIDPLAVDPRSDLYALGCILYEMGTGAPPFTAPTALGLLEQHRQAPAPRLPDHYSPGLRAVVEALNEPGLDSAWSDDTTLGWVYQYWNDPDREALDVKIAGGGNIGRGLAARIVGMPLPSRRICSGAWAPGSASVPSVAGRARWA